MKRILALAIAVFLLMTMNIPAFAATKSISFPVKYGFMTVGKTVTVKATTKGINEVSWTSSDTAIATVESGRITTQGIGRTIITASGSGKSARFGLVVLPERVELQAGNTYSLPRAGVEKYTVKNSKIVKISKNGVISALSAGETTILLKYGKQKIYIPVKVTKAASVKDQSAAATTDCANTANQIVLVDYISGSKAKLSIHEKRDGVWTELYSCTAYVGRNGIGKSREGDGKTPTGTFNLTTPFGIKADPGANMTYTQVTKYHYWCGTSGSEYYNQPVDTRVTDRACTSSDELLIKYAPNYNYCMFIDYNSEGVANLGSCIFLHCTGSKKSTAGCIAINESAMKKIIQWAQPGCKIVIR